VSSSGANQHQLCWNAWLQFREDLIPHHPGTWESSLCYSDLGTPLDRKNRKPLFTH
jgi:hypothetical protein